MALILVHSPKGGVGTTFVTAHLAQAFARRGSQVTAVDFAEQDALKLFFGLLPHQAVPGPYEDPLEMDGVRVTRARDMDPIEADAAAELLTAEGAMVICDIATGDAYLRKALMDRAAMHVCVLAPEPLSLAALTHLHPSTPAMDLKKTVFVLNRIDDRRRLSRHSNLFVRELFKDRLIGLVRRDEAVNEAVAMFEPLAKMAPHSVVLPDFDALATTISDLVAAQRATGAAGDKDAPPRKPAEGGQLRKVG